MMRILFPLGIGLVAAFLAFQATLGLLPGVIMGKAMERFATLGAGGVPLQVERLERRARRAQPRRERGDAG